MGATVLDVTTYEEVEADTAGGSQAVLVVLLSSAAAGIGGRGFDASMAAMPIMAAIALTSWVLWAVLTYQIGAKLLPEPGTDADVKQLLRTLGFAAAPGMFRVVGLFPSLSTAAFAISTLWMLAAMVVAIRQALDYESTGRAVLVTVVAAVLTAVAAGVIGLAFSSVLE